MVKDTFLVTGGCGFIGSHLIEKLEKERVKVLCVDDLSTGYKSNLKNSDLVNFVNVRIQDFETKDFAETIKGVFHLAAQASVPRSIEDFYNSSLNNIQSTFKVFDWANKLEVPIVYASSSAVYGNLPMGDDTIENYDIISPYAQDKLTMEDYARMCWNVYKTPSMGLRFFNVYGPRQDPTNPYSGVISIFIDRLLKKAPVIVNGGYQTRDFIYVKDIVNVLVNSMTMVQNQNGCNVFNIGTGNSVTINKLLSIISEILGVAPEIILKDLPLGDPKKSDGIYEKLKQVLKTNPEDFTTLKTGLLETIETIKQENIN